MTKISIFEKWTVKTGPVIIKETGESEILAVRLANTKPWLEPDQAPDELMRQIAAKEKRSITRTEWTMLNKTHHTVFDVRIRRDIDVKELPQIPEFLKGDGCHYSIAELYPDKERALQKALASNKPFSTGWFGSKKECISGLICRHGGIVHIIAHATDDFDTDGYASRQFSSSNWEVIQKEIRKVEAQAMQCCETQCPVVLVAVGHIEKGRRKDWISTFLHNPTGLEEVPGDCYHEWGWQDDNLSKGVRDEIEKKVLEQFGTSRKQIRVSEFIADWH